ncbi:hypothetical protein AF331_08860 [Rossellomorea marisflavi]|uniref:Uncharacterized protein n=1 Tax=Rossellomorea marisflavi TaxID=189381 RepID=A0A0M0GST2_9BACI|nr:hypothetical protein AF331_08860 [Rossellomorea marisflavi]
MYINNVFPITKSAVQRRPDDSDGNRGMIETPQARGGTNNKMYINNVFPITKSAVQRRPDDSDGNRGMIETPQARGGSTPSPRKAAGRSGTERPYADPHTKSNAVMTTTHSHKQ